MSIKQAIPAEKKAKLILQGEYLLIGIVFIVVGILKLTGIFLTNSEIRFHIFIFITTAGALWLYGDLIWALLSPKRRRKVDLLDKFLMIPLATSILVFDTFSFINWSDGIPVFASNAIGTHFCYIGIVYTFLAIYHWFKPSKMLLEIIAEDKKAELEKEETKQEEDNAQ